MTQKFVKPPNDCAHLVKADEDTEVIPVDGSAHWHKPHWWCVWSETIDYSQMPPWVQSIMVSAHTFEHEKHCKGCPAFKSVGDAVISLPKNR